MKVITSRWNMVNQIYKWKSEWSLLPVTRSCCNLLKLENIRKFLIWKNSKGVANVGDNPLCQATKWHLRVKWGTKKHRTRIVVCFSLSSVVFVSSAWKTVGITNMSAEHVLLPTWSGHKTHTHIYACSPSPPPPHTTQQQIYKILEVDRGGSHLGGQHSRHSSPTAQLQHPAPGYHQAAVQQVVAQVHTTLPHLQTSCTARMNERQE